MRITGLTLERYGTHEGRVLALGRGLTLVTGPNEAGKSTLLDAVSDLLWGFPRPVRHAYAASPARLAIAAEIALPGGELAVRRTTRGLFGPGEEPLEAPWGPGGAQARRTWQQSFGLGHEALREGGARLCEGGGELAELVFTARSGRDVRAILAELDEEADRLYKEHRNAQKVELRRALSAYEHADAAAAEQMSRAGDVAALAEEIGRLERRAAALARDRESAARAGAEAQQRVRAYPAARDVARLRADLAALAASGVVLDAARLAEFDTAREARDRAEETLAELEDRLRGLRAERGEIRVDEGVTADAEQIHRLAGERQARQAEAERLGTLRAEAADRTRRAEELLERIEPGVEPRAVRRRLEALTVPADRAADLDALAAEVERAAAAAERAAEQHREARRTAREAADGAAGPDSAAVARVAEARRSVLAEGSACALRRAALREAADATLRARTALEGTGLGATPSGSAPLSAPPSAGASGSPPAADSPTGRATGAAEPTAGAPGATTADRTSADALPSVPEPPAAARIAAHRTALRQAAEADGQARREVHRAGRRRDAARAALDALVAAGAPADPEALAAARRERDTAVDALLAAVRDPAATDPAGLARASLAVERAVREADALADGMITAADRMAELTRARADVTAAEEEQAAAESAAQAAATARAQARERWLALWGACPAPHPDEADTVRRGLLAARQALAERDHATARAADLAADETAQAATLAAALEAAGRARPGADLDALLRAAEDLEAEADAARDRRTVLHRLRADAERAAAESDARRHDLDQASLRWRHALRAAGGPADAGPASWRVRQEVLAEAVHAEADGRALAAEAKRLAARVSAHEKAVTALAERHLGRALPPAVALPELVDRVRQAAEAAVSARHVDAAAEQAEAEARRVRREASAARQRLDRLAVELWLTAAPEEGGLDAAAERGREAVRIREEEATALALLRTAAPDLDADELVAASETVEESALADELDRARAAAAELAREHEELLEQLGGLRDRRRVLEGADGAAVLHAEAQGHLARAAEAAERYVIVHLQRETLRRELESYERRHSSPLLDEAGRLLERLTGGRFAGLRPAGGEARTLVAARADGEELAPDQLSEGTADQVFLALRLAGIRQLQAERRAAGLPAVPVVLDDVLMTFDDARAAAALAVLGELAADWQVLLFSHHEHLAALARRATGNVAEGVTVIDLGPPAPVALPLAHPA